MQDAAEGGGALAGKPPERHGVRAVLLPPRIIALSAFNDDRLTTQPADRHAHLVFTLAPAPVAPLLGLDADSPWAERARMRADLLECARERLDVGVGEVAREVLFDRVSVVAAGLVDHGTALVGEDDED